jgi:hypothetical protein
MRNGGSRLAAAVALVAAIGLSPAALAAGHHGVSHAGGGTRVSPSGPSHTGTAQRAPVPSRTRVNGTARYGYGGFFPHRGFFGGFFGDPWWGFGWDPWWGFGYRYGWPYYGAYYYAPDGYVYGDEGEGGGYSAAPSGPAVVETDVDPKRADVFLDGENVGNAKDFNGTWDTLSVEPGHHTLEFREGGYRSLVIDLNAQPGRHYVFRDTLAEGTGEDRRTVGAIAPPARRAAPQRGDVESEPPVRRATPPARLGVESEAPPDRDAPRGLARGLLRVHASPEDASVYLDGEFLGLARELARLHGALPVAAGEHRIELVRPGYASVTKRVSVSGEGTTEFSLAMDREP